MPIVVCQWRRMNMAEHDNYDKNILKALQSIDKSLDKIARYLNSLNMSITENKSTDEGLKNDE